MSKYSRKKIIIFFYIFFFITIPIIKNKSRLIEKKIQSFESEIFILEKKLLEANIEFEYLTSPAILSSKIEKNFNKKYRNLNLSQIYLNIEDFTSIKKQITRFSINEK